MLNYIKRDFAMVRGAMKFLSNNKLPDWAIIIWYILLSPVGLVLLPFALLWRYLLLKKIERDFKKYESDFEKEFPTEM